MRPSEIITPLFCVISLYALGWILLSLFVGMRTGWEAGVRLFLLGLSLLVAFSATGAILFYLPNWAAVGLMLVRALLPWISLLRYFIASKFSGKLLLALPDNKEKWSTSIFSGAIVILIGLFRFAPPYTFLTREKSYAIGIVLISLGVLRAIQKIRSPQIRKNGILSVSGRLYEWKNIESYSWKFGEDKLLLKLRKAIFKKTVNLKILSQFRQEVIVYLSQNVISERNNSKSYVPVQKAG